ncbi:AP2-like ethylene-responsive transcription factor [Chloropicon roscoffensis]|uniref:AP2-like ethylene-responsive transcription factor n=1 Tax=Chloropicon roscoffensis TaxID=1461544 RepID=A0AAX4P4I9_9CHLO
MRSEKTEKVLQTLKKWRDDGLITEQEYEDDKREARRLWLQRQSEGEGGDRGQAPDAAEGTLSGQGRGGSGQESDTLLGARATTSSAPRGSEGLAADRSGAGPKASEGPHDDDVGRVEVWRLTKTIDAREVKEMFRGVGTVTEAVVHTQDGSPKARATVTFRDARQAERAVRTMHGKLIEGIGNIGVKMLAPVKEGVRSSPPPPKVEAGAGGSQGGSDGAAKAKPKSTIWSSGLGRSQVSSRMEEEARRREWEATKGVAAVAPVRREPLPQKRGRNGPKNPSSIYRGVTFCKHRGKWVAHLYNKGKQHRLGVHKDEEMAAEAFDKAVIKIRGKDAETNFPPEEYAEEMRSMGASEMSVEEFIWKLRDEARRQNELRSEAKRQNELKAKVDKPKRAKTGYLLFADHMRDQVKEDLTTDLAEGEKLDGKAILSAIAALWREQDKETKEEWQARAKGLRAAVDQTPERAAVEVGPSTSRGAKAVEVDRPGPSKRPRHEGEGEATHAEYYATVADLYHSHEDAAGYENVQLKLES